MKNVKMYKNIIIGFVLSILATIAGIYVYLELISQVSVEKTWQSILQNGMLSTVIALGSIPNILLFFVFIKRKEDYKARGVMLGVIVAALAVFWFRFF